jgi:hypothetical protein
METLMPAFPLKVRTLESYLAGLGASGALIAGAFVAFVLLVGVVTFDAWPTGSGVFSRGASEVSVDTSLTNTPPAREQPNVPNLVKLLGGGGAAASTVTPASTGGAGNPGAGESPSGTGKSPGQREPQGGNPGGGQRAPSEPTQNPTTQPVGGASSAEPATRNVVQQLAYGVGNTVEADTSSLSNTLGGEDTALGSLVGGLGSTLNSTLQGLAGNK